MELYVTLFCISQVSCKCHTFIILKKVFFFFFLNNMPYRKASWWTLSLCPWWPWNQGCSTSRKGDSKSCLQRANERSQKDELRFVLFHCQGHKQGHRWKLKGSRFLLKMKKNFLVITVVQNGRRLSGSGGIPTAKSVPAEAGEVPMSVS